MSEDKKLIPKRRFKEFENAGAWEQRKFGKVFYYLPNNSLSRAELSDNEGRIFNVHYGDVLIKFGEVLDLGIEHVPKIVDESKLKNLTASLLQEGDIIIADAAEDETVGKCSEIRNMEDKTIVSGLHTIPVRPLEKYAEGYLGYYMNSDAYHDQLIPLLQGTKVSSISKSAIQKTKLMVPILENEQKAIGYYFLKLDHLITLHQRKLEKLKADKKAYLSEMFPAEGERKPERRFEGFNDDWEQRKLGGCFSDGTETSQNGELLSVTINDGIKKFKDLNRHDNSNTNKGNYRVVNIGDIAYNSMRMWQGASGYSPYNGIVSPAYTVLKPKVDIDSKFFSYMFKKRVMILLFQFRSQGITSDTWNLKFQPFSRILVKVPIIQEQEKIGYFFQKLDDLITLHQRRLEKLKNIKKAYLNEMFI